jgi:lipopolysaccharide assembly outer membrane protein LptD (OstA)
VEIQEAVSAVPSIWCPYRAILLTAFVLLTAPPDAMARDAGTVVLLDTTAASVRIDSAAARRTGAGGVPGLASDTAAARIRADTAAARDTLRSRESSSGVDSIITYTAADSVVYSIRDRTMFLYGKGDVEYKELGLKAERIDVNWSTSTLRARGVVDTSDTTGKGWKGLPVLIDGKETYKGSTVVYNFKTKRGRIDLARTEIERGLYSGEAIQKSEGDILYVRSGKFTTCELDHPHYYFGSPEMKVFVQDKVVARPVYFYVADVPVFLLPFGVFPSQRGRRSGVIMPGYGESSRGRALTCATIGSQHARREGVHGKALALPGHCPRRCLARLDL